MQNFPITTVGALIFNPLGEILLVQSHKWHHKYGLPGGKIELGETAEQALVREIKEETNLDITDIQFVLYQDSVYSAEFYKPKHFIFLNYQCRTEKTDYLLLNEEAQAYLWKKPSESLSLNLNTPTRLLIEKFLENETNNFSKSSLNYR